MQSKESRFSKKISCIQVFRFEISVSSMQVLVTIPKLILLFHAFLAHAALLVPYFIEIINLQVAGKRAHVTNNQKMF